MTVRVMLISPAHSAALREARFDGEGPRIPPRRRTVVSPCTRSASGRAPGWKGRPAGAAGGWQWPVPPWCGPPYRRCRPSPARCSGGWTRHRDADRAERQGRTVEPAHRTAAGTVTRDARPQPVRSAGRHATGLDSTGLADRAGQRRTGQHRTGTAPDRHSTGPDRAGLHRRSWTRAYRGQCAEHHSPRARSAGIFAGRDRLKPLYNINTDVTPGTGITPASR